MRLLLDENLPKRLKQDFPGHQVLTVRDMGWNGVKNGELMKRILESEINTLLTFDKNFQHQQNFTKFPVTVFILVASRNTYAHLTTLSKIILERIENSILPPGPIVISNTPVGG